MKKTFEKIAAIFAAAGLAGCMVGPDYVAPSAGVCENEIKAENFFRDDSLWKDATPVDDLPKGDWWSIFNDAELSVLLKTCRENSPTLSSAFYKVEQARQTARMDESDLYPWLNGHASYSRVSSSKNSRLNNGQYDNWITGFGITWDVDLFGRIRSILEADIADAQAQLDAYQNLMLLVQSQVAAEYFTIRQLHSERALLVRTLKVRGEQTELVRRRVAADFSDDLDLQRAIQQECEAAAQLAQVERSMASSRNNIAVLIGLTPSQLKLSDSTLGDVLPKLPRAVPSQLLERRPDIAQAERLVYAANARIGAAQAAYFPTVSLTANTDLSAQNIDKLINSSSFAWGISPQIYIPIFQAGRTYAQKQVALAAHKQALENYKGVVLGAIGEVENALSSINNLAAEYEKRSAVTKASLKVQDLTQKQYELGYVDYFSVSDAQRLALLNERQQIALRGDRFRACVNLVAVLGGGWKLDKKAEEEQGDKIEPDFYEGISSPSSTESVSAPEASSDGEKAGSVHSAA